MTIRHNRYPFAMRRRVSLLGRPTPTPSRVAACVPAINNNCHVAQALYTPHSAHMSKASRQLVAGLSSFQTAAAP